ncbi:hypothetical protein Avbf_02514 [Armadillidium vulgare]|nr:hypothetical protein Avbf_02514 [Armadillidium vulgare]
MIRTVYIGVDLGSSLLPGLLDTVGNLLQIRVDDHLTPSFMTSCVFFVNSIIVLFIYNYLHFKYIKIVFIYWIRYFEHESYVGIHKSLFLNSIDNNFNLTIPVLSSSARIRFQSVSVSSPRISSSAVSDPDLVHRSRLYNPVARSITPLVNNLGSLNIVGCCCWIVKENHNTLLTPHIHLIYSTMTHYQNSDMLESGSIADLNLSVSSDQVDTQDRLTVSVPYNPPAVSSHVDSAFIFAELQRLHAALGNSNRQLNQLRAERRNEPQLGDSLKEEERPPAERVSFPFTNTETVESSPVREHKFAGTGLNRGPSTGVRFSLPSVAESNRYSAVTSSFRVPTVSSMLTSSTFPTPIYSSSIMTSSVSESSRTLPFQTLPPGSDSRLDAIEDQLAMVTRSVTMLTQIVAKAYKPKAVPPRKFNAAKEHNLRTFFKQFKRYCQDHISRPTRRLDNRPRKLPRGLSTVTCMIKLFVRRWLILR